MRNRTQILDAAEQVFARRGGNVPLEVIAEQAGVGRGTLYRNFADRTALVLALLDRSLDALEVCARQVSGQTDALFTLLRFSAERMGAHSVLFTQLQRTEPDDPRIVAAQARLRRLFKAPLKRAIEAGQCRLGVTTRDIVLVATMIGGVIHGRTEDERMRAVRRGMQLVIEGLKP